MIKVDHSKCIQCGACADVCIGGTIRMASDGPEATNNPCIRCGHCIGVCPQGAIEHDLCKPLMSIDPALEVTAAAAKQVLLARSSCRNYQNKPVEREKLVELLNVARQALTARNIQGISYIVVQDPARLAAISEAVIAKMEVSQAKSPTALGQAMIDHYRKEGRDTILWNCPALIIAKSDVPCERIHRESAIFCLTYAHLYARSLGLACCWAGALEHTVSDKWPASLKAIDMMNPDQFCGALMVGYPKYDMVTVPERDPLRVEWV